ncbi:hypothetical protein [Rhizobium bangladeshense]|nr:hypothetical protein [Rhizobium bangladeshense]
MLDPLTGFSEALEKIADFLATTASLCRLRRRPHFDAGVEREQE